jgi:hypothetical protein
MSQFDSPFYVPIKKKKPSRRERRAAASSQELALPLEHANNEPKSNLHSARPASFTIGTTGPGGVDGAQTLPDLGPTKDNSEHGRNQDDEVTWDPAVSSVLIEIMKCDPFPLRLPPPTPYGLIFHSRPSIQRFQYTQNIISRTGPTASR